MLPSASPGPTLRRPTRLAQAAAATAALVADAHATGRGARALGHVEALRGDSAAALTHYEQAIASFVEAGSALDEAITRSGALQTLIYLARYEQALQWAALARAVFETAGDVLRLARLDSNVGNVLHRQDRFPEALEHYERALVAFRAQDAGPDAAITLRNIAVCQIALQRFAAAYATYQEARAWCEAHALTRLLAEVDYNIAYLHYMRGEYATAIDLYARARALAIAQADPYHAALCDLDESELYLEINLVPEGAAMAAQAARQFDALGMQYEASKARTTLALAAGHHGRVADALALFDEARACFVAEDNAIWPAQIDLFKAALLESPAPADAYALCLSARRRFARSPLSARTALCDVLLARLALRAGDTDGAAAAIARAEDTAPEIESPALAHRVHVVRGQVQERRGDHAGALDAYRAAHSAIEGMRRHLDHDELKVAFLEDKRVVFESVIALLASSPGPVDVAAIFALVEQAKSRALAEQMAVLGAAASSSDGPTGPAAEVREVAAQLHAVSRQLRDQAGHDRPDRAHLATLRQEARALQGRLSWLSSALEARDPAGNVGATVPLDRVQAALARDAVLIEYHEVRGQLHALVVDRVQATLVPLVAMADVRRRMRLLRFQLGNVALASAAGQPMSTAPSAAVRDHLAWFHDALVEPLAPALDHATRLVIVPHDVLHALPFHAVGREGRALIDTFVVSYAPSASVHYHAGGHARRGDARAVVLGVPDALAPAIGHEAQAPRGPPARRAVGAGRRRDSGLPRDPRPRRPLRARGHARALPAGQPAVLLDSPG